MRRVRFAGLLALVAGMIVATVAGRAEAVIFDDFNVSEFHFGYAPNFSSASTSVTAASTADRIADASTALEGDGFQRLVLIHNVADTVNFRSRHLSGGNPGPTPPGTPSYNSVNAANQPGNAGFLFPTTSGIDGWIGYYARTTATGWVTSINLDGPGIGTAAPLVPGTLAADMDAGNSKALISDGQWHLYEWDLDGADWGAVPGIGGGHGGALVDTTHSIDSIWFRNTAANFADATIDLDFVALNPLGSIANLLPPEENADFDGVNGVGGSDLAIWDDNFGTDIGASPSMGDADGDGDVDGRDFLVWQRQFNENTAAVAAMGLVPEPASAALAALAVAGLAAVGRSRRTKV